MTDPGRKDLLRARSRTYRGISAGTTMICVGVILLLNNLGTVGWGVWFDLLRLWPVLLISLGLRLIFSTTALHPLSLLGPALVVLATVWTVLNYQERAAWTESGWLAASDSDELECPAPAEGRPARLDVRFAAGRLRLETSVSPEPGAGAASPHAPAAGQGAGAIGLHGTLRYEGAVPDRSCRPDGAMWLGRPGRRHSIHGLFIFGDDDNRWRANLASAHPVEANLSLAAAVADVDLRGFRLTGVELDAAATRATLRLGQPAGRVPVEVDGGVATLTILVPDGVCYVISRSRGLNLLEAEGRRDRRRRPRRVVAKACGDASALPGDRPRYEIRYDMPLSTVRVDSEGPG